MQRPHLLALKTAVPPHILYQKEVAERARILFEHREDLVRMLTVFGNTGIVKRHSCVPIGWYEQPHGWADRTRLYVGNAVDLLERVARDCLAQAKLDADDIDAIVVASTTGIATPSLDALVIERMNLRRDIERLPIFGFGCAGGVSGLARAADMARAKPKHRVLFLVVELCGLTFRKDDLSKSNFIAAALFGDGAAGAILSCEGDGPAFGANGEYTWPHSLDIMGWQVEEDGLKALFSQSIPALVAADFRKLVLEFLEKNGLNLSGIESFATHPGGAKVLDALEEALGLASGALADSRAILRDYGNMSAVTALFVLERMNPFANPARRLLSAFGPGFSASFLVLERG